jgi:hypothetical protein
VAFESGISKAQGGQSGDQGASLSIALGAKASGKLFEESHKESFNPTKESALKLEAADMPGINKKTVFSQQAEAPAPEPSKDVSKVLGNAAIAGNIMKSDTHYSPAAVMAADARIGINKKSTAA